MHGGLHIHRRRRGFTLVELLVVIGIIALLISMLMPALASARQKALMMQCLSNERQIGVSLMDYVNNWNGHFFPPGMGANAADPPPATTNVWPCVVFGRSDPPIMMCPNDPDAGFLHSYIMNNHLSDHDIKYWSGVNALAGVTPDKIIVMGEKVTTEIDYYMDPGDFSRLTEPFRHGPVGSNYLFMDWHAEPMLPPIPGKTSFGAVDPWDLNDTTGAGTNQN